MVKATSYRDQAEKKGVVLAVACPETACISSDFNPVNPDIKRIALGEINAGIYTSTIQWELDRYLYKKVVGQQIQDTTIQNFVNTHANKTIGAFYTVEAGLLAAMTANEAEFIQLKGNSLLIQDKLKQINDIDEALLDATETEADTLLIDRGLLVDEIAPLVDSNATHYLTVLGDRATACFNLYFQNIGINAQTIFEQNQQTVNNMYLQYIRKGMQPLAATEITTLDTIAQQCPLSGGHAVFQARALIAMSTGDITFYDDETACAGGQSLQAPHYDLPIAVTEAELTVYPNPAKEELTIINPVDLEETVKVILFDTFGKQVQQIQLNELSKTIDVSHLTNGMYFIQLYSKHKKYATKVIINR